MDANRPVRYSQSLCYEYLFFAFIIHFIVSLLLCPLLLLLLVVVGLVWWRRTYKNERNGPPLLFYSTSYAYSSPASAQWRFGIPMLCVP